MVGLGRTAKRWRMAGLRRLAVLAAATLAMAAPASGQLQPQSASHIFMVSIAEAGERCGHLTDWEAATIRAETRRLLARFARDEQANLLYAAAAPAAAVPCDDAGVLAWVQTARPGIEREWLPPNLALFRAFANMVSPPLTFLAATDVIDLAGAVATIDAKFDELERDGVLPEGGTTWDAFAIRVEDAAATMTASLSRNSGVYTPDEAAAFIVEAAIITTLWLAAQD